MQAIGENYGTGHCTLTCEPPTNEQEKAQESPSSFKVANMVTRIRDVVRPFLVPVLRIGLPIYMIGSTTWLAAAGMTNEDLLHGCAAMCNALFQHGVSQKECHYLSFGGERCVTNFHRTLPNLRLQPQDLPNECDGIYNLDDLARFQCITTCYFSHMQSQCQNR